MKYICSTGVVWVVMSFFLVAGGCASTGINRGQINIISSAEEVEMGQKLSVEIEKQYKRLRNPRIQGYVEQIGSRLVAVSDRRDIAYHFTVLDEPDQVNAFALPGGYIYVYTGLLKKCETEAELAGVLGHEIGHVCARHATEKLTRLYGYQLLLGLALGEEPDEWAGMVANMFGSFGFLKFSRDNEFEADSLAIKYTNEAGYNPEGFVRFMDTLAGMESHGSSALLTLLSTHPPCGERSARLRAQIARLPRPGNEESRQRYRQQTRGL